MSLLNDEGALRPETLQTGGYKYRHGDWGLWYAEADYDTCVLLWRDCGC